MRFERKSLSVVVVATVSTAARTGVEMEALTAAAVACLTIYDMAKSLDREIEIAEIVLLDKTGGRSGPFRRTTAVRPRRSEFGATDAPPRKRPPRG